MKPYAAKIGAVFYGLWGLLHIVGAAVLFQQAFSAGATMALTTIGSAVPQAEVPLVRDGLTGAVLAYYAWNLFWLGLLVLVVAIWLNWRNRPLGYWLNMVVVGAVDLGLLLLLLLPGYMAWRDGGLGLGLWLLAAIFSTLGLLNPTPRRIKHIAPV